MWRTCLCSASIRPHALKLASSGREASSLKSWLRAASTTTGSPTGSSAAIASTSSNSRRHAGKATDINNKKKTGSYASNVKTQLRQDRSSIIRRNTPDGQAISFSTAERYDIDSLRKALWKHRLLGRGDGNDAMNLMGEAIWVPKWPVEEQPNDATATGNLVNLGSDGSASTSGEIFIFETGSFVSWHMSTADAQAFADSVLKTSDTPIEIERYDDPQIEAMGFVVQPGDKTGVKEDMIVIGSTGEDQDVSDGIRSPSEGSAPLATAIEPIPLGGKGPLFTSTDSKAWSSGRNATITSRQTILPRSEDDLRARLSLSSGMARSTKLAVYEEMLDAHMDEVSYIPDALSSGDERPLKKKDILKNTGNLLRIRQHIYLQEENLIDPPEMFWSNASLEIWFKEMARALDIDLRMRNLKTKVDYSLELQHTLSDLNSTKVSHRLEWIIIILIAIEIVMVIMREGIPGFSKKHEEVHAKEPK